MAIPVEAVGPDENDPILKVSRSTGFIVCEVIIEAFGTDQKRLDVLVSLLQRTKQIH